VLTYGSENIFLVDKIISLAAEREASSANKDTNPSEKNANNPSEDAKDPRSPSASTTGKSKAEEEEAATGGHPERTTERASEFARTAAAAGRGKGAADADEKFGSKDATGRKPSAAPRDKNSTDGGGGGQSSLKDPSDDDHHNNDEEVVQSEAEELTDSLFEVLRAKISELRAGYCTYARAEVVAALAAACEAAVNSGTGDDAVRMDRGSGPGAFRRRRRERRESNRTGSPGPTAGR
jgi:hypothetical protein